MTLNWLTRDEDIRAVARVPYRLLEEVLDFSTGDFGAGNMLIHGDNLDALKALLPFYAGRVILKSFDKQACRPLFFPSEPQTF